MVLVEEISVRILKRILRDEKSEFSFNHHSTLEKTTYVYGMWVHNCTCGTLPEANGCASATTRGYQQELRDYLVSHTRS